MKQQYGNKDFVNFLMFLYIQEISFQSSRNWI